MIEFTKKMTQDEKLVLMLIDTSYGVVCNRLKRRGVEITLREYARNLVHPEIIQKLIDIHLTDWGDGSVEKL